MKRPILVAILVLSTLPVSAQKLGKRDSLELFRNAREAIRKNYYDPTLKGVDFDGRMAEAEARLAPDETMNGAFGLVAWTIESLNDSHTYLIPPARPYDLDNGWRMQIIGDRCYVTAVEKGSDADRQKVTPGDQILAVEGYEPRRDEFWKLRYAFYGLAPRSAMNVTLLSRGGEERQLLLRSKVVKRMALVGPMGFREDPSKKAQWADLPNVLVMKLSEFQRWLADPGEMLKRAKGKKGLVLDLRGNPGGSEDVLLKLVGAFFDHDVTIGEQITRDKRKTLIAKSLGNEAFTGKLSVVVDSDSASASELFARTVQLQKRGEIFGDRSSGSVMGARFFPYYNSGPGGFSYAFEVSVADMIMPDGVSLEHTGVIPDVQILPSANDMASGDDPVLAAAIEYAGAKITPQDAGKLIPVAWHKPSPFVF